MKLNELMALIAQSAPTDWVVNASPTFLFRLVPIRGGQDNRTLDLELQEHTVVMTFKPEVSISMAYGMVQDKEFKDDWAMRFPNKRAHTTFLDILYHGALVFRDQMVAVDGLRCILPLPPPNQVQPPFDIPERRLRVAKLVHALAGPDISFDQYFQRVGMRSANHPWP